VVTAVRTSDLVLKCPVFHMGFLIEVDFEGNGFFFFTKRNVE